MKKKYKYYVYILFIYLGNSQILGQSIQDLNRIKQEYDQLKNNNLNLPSSRENNQNTGDDDVFDLQQILPYEPMLSDSSYNNSKYFGYNFFGEIH